VAFGVTSACQGKHMGLQSFLLVSVGEASMQMGYVFCTRHAKAEMQIPFACHWLGSAQYSYSN
jgi:hypothetical protein